MNQYQLVLEEKWIYIHIHIHIYIYIYIYIYLLKVYIRIGETKKEVHNIHFQLYV